MSRLIDHEPNTRTKPMRVLCMGMARTGTNSMTIALRKLGLNPYHGSECFKNPPRDFNLWIEALECNFFNNEKQKKRYGREEFDRFIGPYDAILDVPACIFWSDLHAAYPDAKIILTTRDADSWLKSANKTVFKFVQMPFFRVWQYLDTTCIGPLFRQSELVWRVFCGRNYDEEVLKRAYFEHHERIRNSIPKEQLLEFHTGRDGWEELCGFLDVPVPQEPWPNAYPTAEFQEHIDVALRQAKWTITRLKIKDMGSTQPPYHTSTFASPNQDLNSTTPTGTHIHETNEPQHADMAYTGDAYNQGQSASQSANTGPHRSSWMNKLDPRVESGSGAQSRGYTSPQSSGVAATHGSSTGGAGGAPGVKDSRSQYDYSTTGYNPSTGSGYASGGSAAGAGAGAGAGYQAGPSSGTHANPSFSSQDYRGEYAPSTASKPGAGTSSGETGSAQSGALRRGDQLGKGVSGAFAGIHGAGESLRGALNSAVDRAFGSEEGVEHNQNIARKGEEEIQSGEFSKRFAKR